MWFSYEHALNNSFCYVFLPTFLTIIVSIWLFLKQKHSYWTRRGIPQVKPDFLFGNFTEAVYKKSIPNKVIVDAYHEFKDAGAKHGGIYFMSTPIWIPVDLTLIKQLLYKDFWYFAGHGYFYKHKDDILSNHLFNADGEEWKNLRSKLTPAFSSGKLKLMFDILDEVGDRLERKIGELYQKSAPINIKEVAACYGTDVIASCAFGLECNTLENPSNDFRKYGKMAFEPRFFSELMEQFFNWELLNFFGHTWLNKNVNRFFLGLVRNMIDYRDKNNISRNDFLHILLQLRNKENVKDNDEKNILTFEEIVANVFLMYAAGFETTSMTISFIMYELARNPDVQDKLREEIWGICKNRPNHQLGYDDLKEMKYCEMVINESLRRHTVATEVPRKCTSNYKIPGTDTIIEKGTFVLIPTWAIHNDPEYYPDPHNFNPENFSDESRASRHELSFFPFGEGPRLCIGYRFAMIQIKLALVKYLRKYKYELNSSTSKILEYEANNVTIVPKGDVLLDITEVDLNNI